MKEARRVSFPFPPPSCESANESEGMGGGVEGGREGERNTGAGCPAALIGGDLAATATNDLRRA